MIKLTDIINELGINKPIPFSEFWVKQNIETIVMESGLDLNLDENLTYTTGDCQDDEGEGFISVFVHDGRDDECEGLEISDNLSYMDYNDKMEGPGSAFELLEIKGIQIVVRQTGC